MMVLLFLLGIGILYIGLGELGREIMDLVVVIQVYLILQHHILLI
jgi:hypothetical protein